MLRFIFFATLPEEGHGEHAFPGSGHQRPEEEELRYLKHELEVAQQERDVLKKQSPSSRTRSREISLHRGTPERVLH